MTKSVFFHVLIIGLSVLVGVWYTGSQLVSLLGASSGIIYYGTQFMFHYGEEMKLIELGGVGVYIVVCKYFMWLIIFISVAHGISSVIGSLFSKKEDKKSRV